MIAKKEEALGITKTPLYRVIDAMLEMSTEMAVNTPITFLKEWELELAIESLREHSFNKIEPEKLWTLFLEFNEALANKIRNLNRTEQIWLILKILHERKKRPN